MSEPVRTLVPVDWTTNRASDSSGLDPQTMAWLTTRRDALRGLLRRSARDLVEIGHG